MGRVWRLGDKLEGYHKCLRKVEDDISLDSEEEMVTMMEIGFTRLVMN